MLTKWTWTFLSWREEISLNYLLLDVVVLVMEKCRMLGFELIKMIEVITEVFPLKNNFNQRYNT
jgi:hypothetical protein